MDRHDLARFERDALPHLDAAYTLARYLLRDEHDADDVVQEAYLRALRYFETFRGGDMRAWLLTIVRRTAFTWLGRRRDERRREASEPLESVPLDARDPEAEMLRGALHDALHEAIRRLPPEFREVVILRDVQGLSYAEIAEIVGIPKGTVMSRLARARQRLQRALPVEDYGRS
ncbi:MAG TPA: sigma-70 family RNA polymerase sigma factor [Gemmatimonadales bacterium]|nr:sigma-70 family RNA polymerase sigma factor [Gemmatimonadales bacterium]